MQDKEMLESLRCVLLPGKYGLHDAVPALYNQTYDYWKKTWADFFAKAGSPENALNIENYMRHTFQIVIVSKETVAATLSSTLFNLGANTTFDHPSVRLFPESVLVPLRKAGTGACMTAEYLSVHPEFRKTRLGLSLADTIIGILMKIYTSIQAEILLATTVRKAQVDTICRIYGYEEIGSFTKLGVDCIMMTCSQRQYREHSSPGVRQLVNQLWNSRHDETGLTTTSGTLRRVA